VGLAVTTVECTSGSDAVAVLNCFNLDYKGGRSGSRHVMECRTYCGAGFSLGTVRVLKHPLQAEACSTLGWRSQQSQGTAGELPRRKINYG
jgi:hypothetical protein